MTSTPAAPSSVTIHRASAADAELVSQMVHEIAAHEDSLDTLVAGPDQWRRMLDRPDVQVLVAYDADGTPLGYVSTTRRLNLWLAADVIGLDDLWVRHTARDHGVGGRLMAAVARIAAEEHLTIVWGAEADNTSAHRFYRRLGARLHTKVVASWTPDQYVATIDG